MAVPSDKSLTDFPLYVCSSNAKKLKGGADWRMYGISFAYIYVSTYTFFSLNARKCTSSLHSPRWTHGFQWIFIQSTKYIDVRVFILPLNQESLCVNRSYYSTTHRLTHSSDAQVTCGKWLQSDMSDSNEIQKLVIWLTLKNRKFNKEHCVFNEDSSMKSLHTCISKIWRFSFQFPM